jgi:hypothetical protein
MTLLMLGLRDLWLNSPIRDHSIEQCCGLIKVVDDSVCALSAAPIDNHGTWEAFDVEAEREPSVSGIKLDRSDRVRSASSSISGISPLTTAKTEAELSV